MCQVLPPAAAPSVDAARGVYFPLLLIGFFGGIEATTLDANAAMRSIIRRDTGESYMACMPAAEVDLIAAAF